MTATPEFSRRIALSRIGARPTGHEVSADAGECAALAERFGLIGVDRLEAKAQLVRDGEDIRATGTVAADVTRACVVTGEDVATHVEEAFDLRLRAQLEASGGEEEVEIGKDDLDILFHDSEAIDLGEIAAETAMLALPLFPRASGADEAAEQAGALDEEEAGPFGALKSLRDKLSDADD